MNTPAPEPKRRTKKTAAAKTAKTGKAERAERAEKTAAKEKAPAGKRAAAGRTRSTGGRTVGSGELRSGPAVGTALVSGETFRAKGLPYADVDGLAMFEGDIVLGTVKELENQAAAGDAPMIESIGIPGQQFRWPNATVPFEIDPALPNAQRVTDAIGHWEAHTRIRFVQRTPANAGLFPDFVRFVPGEGCSSMVGRQGGRQPITLGPNCTAGNAIHEIGHTVGLWHEQSREDRDRFIKVVFSNIDPSMQFNFLQHIADGDDLGPYDYGSVMHYPPTAFAIDPSKPTLVPRQPLPPGVVMGQRTGLSQGDIDGVHALYPVTRGLRAPAMEAPALGFGSPFALAGQHRAAGLADGPSDGLAEQVRRLTQLVGELQLSHSSLVSQLGSLFAGRAGQQQ
ncbi:Dot/Icm T4SS effector Zinc-dependent metalloprotease LegP [Streptomyces sp. NPDC032472]|uniref:Dot/Icm T4SS effector Zinc-dependent metalloprotease LegP n=1 Tax=Streptomyces sp. NPDC032472 TaxID=3155018 RepID=UPI003403E89D